MKAVRLHVAIVVVSSLAAVTADAAPPRKVVARTQRPARRVEVAPPRREIVPAERAGKDPRDPHEQRITALRERLSAILREPPLNRTLVGVEVVQASNGDPLFAYNAERAFNPASNTKMITTAAAMAMLGADYRYRTTLEGPEPDDEGVVPGDVILRGSGDPSLVESDLAQLASRLAHRGVRRIEGDLIADPNFRGAPRGAPKDPVTGGAIIFNRNTYEVRVWPSEPGQPARVSVRPEIDFLRVESHATTVAKKRSRLRFDVYRRDDKLVVTVRGRISDRAGVVRHLRRVPDGALLGAWVLADALAGFGIELGGEVRLLEGAPPEAPVLLAEHRSAPLSEICRISNKPSNNFVAEAIWKTLGGELYGQPGTLEKGQRAIHEYLGRLGIPKERYVLVNGSGLTHSNRITPHDLSRFLRTVQHDLAVAPDFMTSLAVSGIDGTIRNRFSGTSAVGLVRAKTGTLNGESALSGYVGEKDDTLIFSIFVHGFRHKKTTEVRRAQVRMVEAMLAYLRADAPVTAPEGRDVPGVDYEGDGDPELGTP